MRYAALVLALAPCALFGQGEGEAKQAEKLFRQMQGRLAKADTIRVKYKAALEIKGGKPGENDKGPRHEGLLLLQKGNKLRLEVDGRLLPLHKPGKVLMVSDGKTIRAGGPGPLRLDGKRKARAEEAPANLREAFAGALAREGVLLFLMSHLAGGTLAENVRDDLDRKQAPPGGFKMRGRERVGGRDTRVIEFRVKVIGADGMDMPVTLWLDAKTGLPVKRVLRYERGGKVFAVVTEAYGAFELDGKIDPVQFAVGKE